MVIKNRLRFFLFFFSFVLILFISVKSCVKTKPGKYVEVEADKVSPVPQKTKNTQSLVNFIEEVKESAKEKEAEELSLAQIELKEKELLKHNLDLARKNKIIEQQKYEAQQRKKELARINKKKAVPSKNKKSVITYKSRTPKDIILSGGESSLNGYSRAKLNTYARQVKTSLAKKIHITGYYVSGESKLNGFARAERVKSLLIGSGVRNKTIYVFSKKKTRSPSSVNFDWSKISAQN